MLSLLHYKNVTVLCMAEDEAVVICYVAFFYAQGRLAFCIFFFFFNDTAPTEFSSLPLHDSLPIYIPLQKWDPIFGVNVRGPFLVSQTAQPHWRRRRGRIINLGPLGGLRAWPSHSHYCSS